MTVKSYPALFALLFLAFTPLPALAQDVSGKLAFPLVCDAGASCFILGYPDVDKEPKSAKDYTCGPAHTDGSPFLRIGLSSIAEVKAEVPVLAVTDGKVIDVLDGLPDLVISSKQQLKRGTPLCGNGVVIDHGDIQSAYCHLKKDSITVKKGDTVVRGRVIALAGQSGLATWPQLGFSIKKGGYYLDPMTGYTAMEGCGFKANPMLEMPAGFAAYQPASIVAMGFATREVAEGEIVTEKAPRYTSIHSSAAALTMWGLVLGVRQGDEIEVMLRTPRGRRFENRVYTVSADTDRYLINVTRPRGFAYWSTGLYKGQITIRRTIGFDRHEISREVSVMMEEPKKAD